MKLLSTLDGPARKLVLGAGALVLLACGCSLTPPMAIQCVLATKSCTDDAKTMTFRMQSSSPILTVTYLGGTPNVVGIPIAYSGGSTLDIHVVTDLNDADFGEPVAVKFASYVNVANYLTVSLSDVAFFKLPSYANPEIPDCAVIQAPWFKIHSDVSNGLTLDVSNASALPLTLVSLDLVELPDLLPVSALDWDDPVFNALPWQPAVPAGGTVLDGASPPIMVDLPDAAAGGPAILCRFISIYDGQEIRGIMQANLDTPLATKATTWGKVKALYRN